MTMRSVAGSSVSRCQTISGLRPLLRSSAMLMSRSRFEPGKTTMVAFMADLRVRRLAGGLGARRPGMRSHNPRPIRDQGAGHGAGNKAGKGTHQDPTQIYLLWCSPANAGGMQGYAFAEDTRYQCGYIECGSMCFMYRRSS